MDALFFPLETEAKWGGAFITQDKFYGNFVCGEQNILMRKKK